MQQLATLSQARNPSARTDLRYSERMQQFSLVVLLVSMIFEVGLMSLPTWLHKGLAVFTSVVLGMSIGLLLVVDYSNVFGFVVVCISAYRWANVVRLAAGRMTQPRLGVVFRRTSLSLIAAQLGVFLLWWLSTVVDFLSQDIWWLLVSIQFVMALGLFASTFRSLRKTKFRSASQHYSDVELPSVSVAVPARNEDEQLDACLTSILASDYPKTEVLVLDDCSQDRTPEVIRGFAHDGVRFIAGDPPSDHWLAKNFAYQQLLDTASGEIIVFCGVDARFQPASLRELVSTMLSRQKTMVSVLPQSVGQSVVSLVQPMRYFWELALPRRQFNRPPVLSTCWLVRRDMLKAFGGFAGVSRSISPEAQIAKQATAHDGYSFVRSTPSLGVSTRKPLREQRATAIRTRYPQLHRRPELVCLWSLLEVLLLVAPFVVAIFGYWWHIPAFAVDLAIVSSGLLVALNTGIAASTSRRWLHGVWSFPFAVLTDIVLLNYSMWQYEFSEVIWKGRNVCIPVMRATPYLPKF